MLDFVPHHSAIRNPHSAILKWPYPIQNPGHPARPLFVADRPWPASSILASAMYVERMMLLAEMSSADYALDADN